MKFERGLYAEPVRIMRNSYVIVSAFTIGGLIFTILAEQEKISQLTLFFPETLFWAVLAYYIHTLVLFPKRSLNVTYKSAFLIFFKRAYLLAFISIALAIAVNIVMFVGFDLVNSADEQQNMLILTFIGILTWSVVTGLMFPMLGTWLPAAVVEDGTGIKEAFRRGRSTYWWTFIRLILGPGLVIFVSTQVFWSVGKYLGSNGEFYTAIRDFDAPVIALHTALQIANCFATITFAVVLSRAYLRATSSDSKGT